ncbi:MAG: ribosome-associated translation inhibitor RaiA [Acidimicrobiia bacterium]
MEIVVRGKNVEVPASLRASAMEKLAKVNRFAQDASRIEVDFSELRNKRIPDKQLCEVTVHLKGAFVKAHASSTDAQAALDLVVDKVEHQVSRLKEKRVGRSHPRRKGLQSALRSDYPSEPELDEGDQDHAARIVKTKQFAIKPMQPEEAALHMDLLGHDFFFFTNASTGAGSVIYRRHDGHFGLIEAGD